MAGGIQEWQELAFPQPDGFTTLSQAWIAQLQFINAEAGQGISSSCQIPGNQSQGHSWLPGGCPDRGAAAGKSLLLGQRERSAALWQHGKSIPFFISTAEYYYALCMAFMNVCLTMIYLPEINSLLSLQTSNQCHHLSSLQISQHGPLHPEQETWFLNCHISYKSLARNVEKYTYCKAAANSF